MGEDMEGDPQSSQGSKEPLWADIAVRFALVALLAFWSLLLLRPFVGILVWAAIISVAMYPVYLWLRRVLGDRSTLASALISLLLLGIIVGPVSAIGAALVANVADVSARIAENGFTLPPPPASVADWPLIGETLSAFWLTASAGLTEALKPILPQLQDAALKLLGFAGSIGLATLEFVAAIILSGFIYSRAEGIDDILNAFARRVTPQMGEGFVDLASGTVRSVARGVIGIAIIQATLFGIGTLVAGIPLAGLWAFLALILAIIQIGLGPVMIPILIYAWFTMEPLSAGLLTAYLVPISLIDNLLKPILMGRGLPVPMLVILIGVIGGTLAHGITGLFIGPIVLSLGYEVARAWIGGKET